MKKHTQEIHGVFTPSEKNNIPELPGVYIYKDSNNDILYIGKAKNLKKRVSSYFIKTPVYLKTHLLVQQIKLIDIIIVENESEALFLEATLIKKHLPKFNINFKDGKFYPYIKITSKDKFPRIFMTRNKINDGSIYFGPYTSAGIVRSNIELIQKIFQIRNCRILPKKECLEYHMGRCSAPCINKITTKEYNKNITKAMEFLSGNKTAIIDDLHNKMKTASKEMLFEKAQIYKEQLDAIYALDNDQHVYLQSENNIDIIGIQQQGEFFGIAVSLIRQGKLSGKLGYTVKQKNTSPENILEEFIISHYAEDLTPPNAIIIQENFKDLTEPLTKWFDDIENPISINIPSDDHEISLLRLAEKNAVLHLETAKSEPDILEALTNLQKELNLKNFPSVIEGFDVAKLDGTLASGVAVQFQGGEPVKENYRLYNIKADNQQDDFIAMEEMLTRHYTALLNAKKSLPQLIVIDGGKGQLSSACKALENLGIDSVDIISIAKKEEEIFKPHQKIGTILPKNSSVLHLLQRVRDESHRFSQFQLHRRMDKKLRS